MDYMVIDCATAAVLEKKLQEYAQLPRTYDTAIGDEGYWRLHSWHPHGSRFVAVLQRRAD